MLKNKTKTIICIICSLLLVQQQQHNYDVLKTSWMVSLPVNCLPITLFLELLVLEN